MQYHKQYSILMSIFMEFSAGTSWTRVSFVCDGDDVHFLYLWNYDVGWCYIFNPGLGGNVPVHIGAVRALFPIFIHNVSNSYFDSSAHQVEN